MDLARALAERDSESVRVQGARSSVASVGRNAVELVARSIDPETGHIQTFRIALWVADATKRDFDVAAQAYAAIEAQLLSRGSGELARFNQDLVQALQADSVPGRKRLLVSNPVLDQTWSDPPAADRREAVTGLRALLERHGLRVPAAAAEMPRRLDLDPRSRQPG